MPAALVTGPAEPAEDVAATLRSRGFETRCLTNGLPLAVASTSIPEASIGCYVQLPGTGLSPSGAEHHPNATARNLLNRFDALGLVARLLAPDATTLLVTDDDGDAALLRLLATAVLAEHGAATARTRVVNREALQSAIPTIVPATSVPHDRANNDDLTSYEPDMGFADWRCHVLSLATDYWIG